MGLPKLSSYTEYRDSTHRWIGEIPAHWDLLPHRTLFLEIKERGFPDEELLSVSIAKGVMRQVDLLSSSSKKDSSNEDKSKYKLVHPNDIVFNKMRAWQGAIGISKYKGIVSPAYIVQRLRNRNEPLYFHYLFRTPHFAKEAERWSYGITSDQWSLRPEDFKCIYSPIPPLEEQQKIVKFIQHKDRRIRKFIQNKKQLIQLLERQKQRFTLKILSSGVGGKHDFVETHGEWPAPLPSSWKLLKIKYCTKILRGKFSHRPRNDPALYGGEYPFIQTGDVARADKFVSTYKQTLNEDGRQVSKQFPKGTVVMTIAANIGDVAIIGYDACFPDSIVGFSPFSFMDNEFLYVALSALKEQFLLDAPVNTQGNLNIERISRRRIPVPPIHEQVAIVQAVNEKCLRLDETIKKAKAETVLVQEYHSRLIADAITGKIDLRSVSIPTVADDDSEEPYELLNNGLDSELEPDEDEQALIEEVAYAN